ncbi:MAG TPA: hypothetical protein PK102_02240, partial [bacterium]|nr:hypothetical protein [bacterium]
TDFDAFYACANGNGCIALPENERYLCLVNNCSTESTACGIDMPDCSASDCSTPFDTRCSLDNAAVESCDQHIDGCYYWTTVESCGDSATCSESVEPVQCVPNVVYPPVRDIVQDSTNGDSTKKNVFKGNEFACNHNATIQNVEIYLDPSWDAGGDTSVIFGIFEKQGDNSWMKIFEKGISFSNFRVSAKYFSTGEIAVEFVNGKNYAIGAYFNRDCKYYYRNSVGQDVNFGSQVVMISKEGLNGLPTSLDNIDGYTIKMAITSQLK